MAYVPPSVWAATLMLGIIFCEVFFYPSLISRFFFAEFFFYSVQEIVSQKQELVDKIFECDSTFGRILRQCT